MYYVYDLIDPRDGRVFYVGKGKGDRLNEHARQARQGAVGLKCDLIREIVSSGHEVTAMIVRHFDDEDAAYAFEKRRIASIGLENLTNIASGGREMSVAQFAERRLARKLTRSLARMLRVLAKHREVRWRAFGKWRDLPLDVAFEMARRGITEVFDCLGKTEATAAFLKAGVVIENRA